MMRNVGISESANMRVPGVRETVESMTITGAESAEGSSVLIRIPIPNNPIQMSECHLLFIRCG